MKEAIWQKLDEYYNFEVPGYVQSAGKSYLTIKLDDWQGKRRVKVNVADVMRYYAEEAGNITSGIRELAGEYGDWRMIDNLAQEVLGWLKLVNRAALDKEARKHGMELK